MRILVTGITGFCGSHLTDFILRKHPKTHVYGVARWRSPNENVNHLLGKVSLIRGDLTDPSSVRSVLEESKPDFIFHLAAQSFVKASFDQPMETINTNLAPTLNLLHGLREKLAGGMLFAGTSEEYGRVLEAEVPIKETNPLRPLSPYAVSKVAADMLCYQYHQSYGIEVVRGRGFNHEGPRRGEQFVTSTFAKQIMEVELGLRPPKIKVGNLDAVRDYTDVRDMVKAYWAMMEHGRRGDIYNACSANCGDKVVAKPWRIKEILDFLVSEACVDVSIENDPARMRPSDVPVLVGDFKKLNTETGWMPKIDFKQTLRDTLEYWREKLLGLPS